MKEIKERLKHLFSEAYPKSFKEGIQVLTLEGQIVYLNEIAKKRLGIEKLNRLFVWDFEPYFLSGQQWEEHVAMLKEIGEQTVRSTHLNIKTKEETAVELTVSIKKIENIECVFAMSKDISCVLEQENRIEQREKMLLAISEATSELLNNRRFFNDIVKVLEIIGKAVNVDRTYLFTLDEKSSELVSQRSEWNSGDAEPQIDNPELQGVPLSLFEGFLDTMYQRKPFQSIVEKIPNSPLKDILMSQGIISILIIPVFRDGRFWGFIGYDECQYERVWHDVELSILQTLSNNITTALERLDYNNQIETLAEFPMENPAPVVRIDVKGNVLFQNKIDQIQGEYFRLLGNKKALSLYEFMQYIANDLSLESVSYYEVKTTKNSYYSITAKLVESKGHINLYFSDTSKLKETELELKKTKTIVDQVVSNMKDVVWSVSYPDYKSLYISPSTEILYGIPAKDFYQTPQIWTNKILDEDKHIIDLVFENIEKNKEIDVQYRIKTHEGVKWVNNRVKAISNKKGKVYRIDGLVTEITEKKKINDQLKVATDIAVKSNKAKDYFIANISHEIRTPLNAILGLSNILKADPFNSKNKEYIEHIISSGSHLSSLIENVLDMAKINEGKIKLTKINFVFADLLGTIQSIFYPLSNEKGINFNIHLSEDVSKFFVGDYLRIKQILINVISNAVKFTEKGAVLLEVNQVHKKGNKETVEFKVTDSGSGIEKKFLKEIYNKFARSEAHNEPGSGLGMTIAHELIHLMNGDIHIESKVGVGTTVYLKLPFEVADSSLIPESQDNLGLSNRRLNVLHAEDNPLNRLIVKNILDKFNVELTEAENGKEAYGYLKLKEFDCVLMDIQMPLMSGFQVTEKARKKLSLKTPIIGISANALFSQVNKSKNYGMNNYLTKPFDSDALVEIINSLLMPLGKKLFVKKSNEHYNPRILEEKEYSEDFKKQMFQLFIEKTPLNLQELRLFLKQKDIQGFKNVIHKIKPSFEIFGINGTNKIISFIMSIDETNDIDWEVMNNQFNRLKDCLKLAIHEMRLKI